MSRAVLSDRLNTKVSSSGFMQKVAAAKYYGFVELEKDGKIGLTELGQRFANKEEKAAQEGFANSAFGHIAYDLRGHAADVSVVALHLADKKNVPQASAERLAAVLLRAAKEANLTGNNGFDAERLEQLEEFIQKNPTKSDQPSKASAKDSSVPSIRSNPSPASIKQNDQGSRQAHAPVVEPSSPHIILHLNTAPLSYDDSVKLVNLLAKGGLNFEVKQPEEENHRQ